MSTDVSKHKRIVAAFRPIVAFSLLWITSTAFAEGVEPGFQEAESELLATLAEAADEKEARNTARELEALWSSSGSDAMDLLLKRGRDALTGNDPQAAIEHLTALTDHAPGFAEGWHTRAMAYFDAEMYGPALADLERALALNPSHYDAIYGLGTMFELFGDPMRAHEAYLRVQTIHPYHEEVGKALDRLGPDVKGKSL